LDLWERKELEGRKYMIVKLYSVLLTGAPRSAKVPKTYLGASLFVLFIVILNKSDETGGKCKTHG
jgi:hypothetical protein